MSQSRNSTLSILIPIGLLLMSCEAIDAQSRQTQKQEYGNLPLSFEENRGQTDSRVRFLSRGSGYSIFLTDEGAVLALGRDQTATVMMRLAGAASHSVIVGENELPGTANYFGGNDPAKWITNVPTSSKVRYKGVYPGVDLIYYGNGKQLEYDFVVAAGGDPRQVRLTFGLGSDLKIDKNGSLLITSKGGQVAFAKPVVYQTWHGQTKEVWGQFKLLGRDTVGFQLGKYDRSRELIIDPVLSYATYLGGSLQDYATGIAVDGSGNAYVTGPTGSPDFPFESGSYKSGGTIGGTFVTKINSTGTALIYSVYLANSFAWAVAVDSAGCAYVTGFADFINQSSGVAAFPTTPKAFQPSNHGASNAVPNAFVTKLSANGSSLDYSTYLGGSGAFVSDGSFGGDQASAIAVDSNGDAFVAGNASSTDFPTTSGSFRTYNPAAVNQRSSSFITKLNASGSGLVYSTYFGGSGDLTERPDAEWIYGLALDKTGSAYVTGTSGSSDFPITPGVFQVVNNTSLGEVTGFVAKLNPAGSAITYGTYIGGSVWDVPTSIAVDSSDNAYITGYTAGNIAPNFPVTIGSYEDVYPGQDPWTGFVAKLNPAASKLVYSTYLGAFLTGLAVDSAGDAYVTGTGCSGYPVTADAFQQVCNSANASNGVFTKLNAAGSALVYSTFIGGSNSVDGDGGSSIAIDIAGNTYLGGTATSADFPVTPGALQLKQKGTVSNAFIAKFGPGAGPTRVASSTTLTTNANPEFAGTTVTFAADVKPLSGSEIPTGAAAFSIDGVSTGASVPLDSTGHADYSTNALTVGKHTVQVTYSGDIHFLVSSGSFTETIVAGVQLTFKTLPAGLSYSVDGTSYNSQKTLTFAAGSKHTIATSSPQTSAGVQNTFSGWSDKGTSSHSITATAATTYTASFNTAYLLTMTANPSSGGSVSPATGAYYAAGSTVSIKASPKTGYAFKIWTGNAANATAASTTVTMSAPQSLTGLFVASSGSVLISFKTSPSGLSYSVDGITYTTPETLTFPIGSEHTVSTVSPQTTAGGIKNTFNGWSDKGAQTHMITITATATYAATFSTAYLLTTGASPAVGGSVSPQTGTYYSAGAIVSLTATANKGYSFLSWSGAVANKTSASTTVTMNAPQSVTANF